MKDYCLDIQCSCGELAKQVAAALRFAGSGTFAHPDELSFRMRMNPMHVGLLCEICQNMAVASGYAASDVRFYHDGEELS